MARGSGRERQVRHVAFPAVNCNGFGMLIKLECVAHLDRHGHPQTPDRRFDEVIRRYRGRQGDVNPPFTFFDTDPRLGNGYDLTGESFQLAIVIADRMVRYGYSEARPIVATGCLPGNDGIVGTVDQADFDGKLDLLAKVAPAASLFIFPQGNAVATAKAKIASLEAEHRLVLRPIETLNDVSFLWTPVPAGPASRLVRQAKSFGRRIAKWFGLANPVVVSAATLTAAALIAIFVVSIGPDRPTAIAVGSRTADGGPKSINTAGERGAYHTLFCPPLPVALSKSYFQGYKCTPSQGTLENIERALKGPTSIGFVQLDMFASEAIKRSDEFKKLAIIRSDIACEGLWMVTRNPDLNNYGDVLRLARRIPFILPAPASGSAASFAFLQANDPAGLGRVPEANKRYVADATAVLNEVASNANGAVGFFVQFADPESADFKLIVEKALKVIPVASRDILQIKLAGQQVYQLQTFELKSGGVFVKAAQAATVCTPVAIITGSPEVFGRDHNKVDDQKDMIERIHALPAEQLLPQESRMRGLIRFAKKLSDQGIEDLLDLVETTRSRLETPAN